MKNVKIISVKQILFASLPSASQFSANAQSSPTEQQVSLRAPA